MRQLLRRSWSRSSAAILTAELGALALVFSVAIGDAGIAAAQPAAGYTASLIPTGETASVAVDPDTDIVYFAAFGDDLAVVDAATNAVTTTIPLPSEATAVAVDPVTDTVYAAVEAPTPTSPDLVAVIDGTTNAVTSTIALPMDADPFAIAVNSSTDMVYVADDTAEGVSVIDGSTNSVTATVGTGTAPVAIAVDETTNVVWVGDTDGDVQAISGASNTVTETISLGSGGDFDPSVAVDPVTDTVYATNEPGEVAIIDGATGTISTTISPGTTTPGYAVAVDPDTGTVFVSAPGEWGTTWVIDASSNTVTDTVERGGRQVAVDTATGSAYVAPDSDSPRVSWALTPSTANAMSPVFATSAPLLTAGTAASVPIDGSALPAATYSETGPLPAGVTLSSSGVFSGTPAAGSGGVYTITVTASNGVPPDYSLAVTLTVDEAPAITSADQATFMIGVENSFTVSASGYPASTFSASGSLPAGVTLSSAGLLSGPPPGGTAGSYPIQITASNGIGTAATQAFTLTVTAAPAAAVGAEGGNGELYVQAPQLGSEWQPEGGQIAGAPAVAAAPNPTGSAPADLVFIATGSNGELWMLSLTAGWQPVGPSEALCIGSPAAVISSDGTLTVACEGLNRQLYYTTTAMPSSGLPSFTGPWTSLGGILSAGPAVALVGGTLTFFAEGTNGQVFTNTGSGYTATPWICIGTLAAATQAASGDTYFGCQGGDHSLWTASNDGAGWSSAASLGGQLLDGPGIAATSELVEFFAEGTNGTVWEWTNGTGWATIGGIVTGGVGASALN